jgi:sec-independent protein translocase protein TatB
VFSNLSWYEVVALLLIAMFIFGDKLPKVIGDGLRMLRNLRRMAQNATSDLSRELGTEIQLEDLNPRSLVRKHLLSEADQERLLTPLKGVSEEVVRQSRGVERELKGVSKQADSVAGAVRRSSRRGFSKPRRAVPAAPVEPDPAPADPPPPPASRYEDIT